MAGPDSLLLASRSPRRRQLLRVLGVPFALLEVSEIEATFPFPGGSPAQQAQALAQAKAEGAAAGLERGLMLAADTIVVVEGLGAGPELNRPTTYDCCYLALAQLLACDFWTADEHLQRALGGRLPWVRWLKDYASGREP